MQFGFAFGSKYEFWDCSSAVSSWDARVLSIWLQTLMEPAELCPACLWRCHRRWRKWKKQCVNIVLVSRKKINQLLICIPGSLIMTQLRVCGTLELTTNITVFLLTSLLMKQQEKHAIFLLWPHQHEAELWRSTKTKADYPDHICN